MWEMHSRGNFTSSYVPANRNFVNSGGRASALSLLLGLNERHGSLAAIAREANTSRAIVSRWLLQLRDEFKIGLSMRGSLIRDNCRLAQRSAVAEGRHSSVTRKTPDNMNASEIRKKFRTLDQARAEIERLQNPGNSSSTGTASKMPLAQAPPSAPRLEDLSRRELTEILDVAHRRGDQALVATVYAELQKRRAN
jgi:hypothetical protein